MPQTSLLPLRHVTQRYMRAEVARFEIYVEVFLLNKPPVF